MFQAAVNIAKQCILESGKSLVLVGSIGSYATYLRDGSEYSGNYTKKPDFSPQVIILYFKYKKFY